jgi:putative nucleotidyltransferase with HDIG domain
MPQLTRTGASVALTSSPAQPSRDEPRRPPRFLVRVLVASFATVVLVLGAVIALLGYQARQAIGERVREELEAGQRLVAMAQGEQQRNATVQATVLTQTDALAVAFEQSRGGRRLAGDDERMTALEWELRSVEALLDADVVGVTDEHGTVVSATGRSAAAWRGQPLPIDGDEPATFETFVTAHDQPFTLVAAPIRVRGARIGHLVVGTAIDAGYMRRLAHLAHSGVAFVVGGRLQASEATPQNAAFAAAVGRGLQDAGSLTVDGEAFAYRRIRQVGPASFYAIDSVTAKVGGLTAAALPKLAMIVLGSLALCLLASFRLARSVSAPIDRLSREMAEMADHSQATRLPPSRATSRELATLMASFNRLSMSLSSARAETDAAVVGAIRALAAALDARDAYTAGHSERVSAISVAIGRQMHLEDADIEVLRLGALLHDIGKIGISDNILGKAGALTDEEYEIIKSHPVLGAQILRTVAFLEPHLPIVELHHEQPDGLGYPHGLKGEQIPLLARIVHVADAFDAMTTARAYRAGRPAADALAVLWKHAGTQFDLDAVRGISAALPEFLHGLPTREERAPAEIVPLRREA